MKHLAVPVLLLLFLLPLHGRAQTASFEEAVVDVGNLGLTVTNAGFIGRANVRNNPTGPPSMEYPLDSGVEHLFESGLWVGAVRSDGVITVRTGAVTAAGGYRPGATGYEFAQLTPLLERSTLPTSEVFTRSAVSHQDYLAAFVDTAAVLPGTSIQMPDPRGRLGMKVEMETFAWNFPFTEFFVILNWKIINISEAAWDNVYVGMYHDLVVRNVNTTTESGSAFFNKGGYGFIDSLYASYAFNAGGNEETLNTYGAIVFLGAEWPDPTAGRKRFFHPALAEAYAAEGLPRPQVNPRWWLFSGGLDELARPASDEERYRRMATPFPNPDAFPNPVDFEAARAAWFERLRTDGQNAAGNWIGLTPIGPFPRVAPGDTLTVTYAVVAALKPEAFQGQAGKPVDTPESRALLANNIAWARRTYAGEDNNLNGTLDPGEDVNGNGVLDRYLIPEPPAAPRVRVAFENDIDPATGRQKAKVVLYWDRTAELSRDPVTGRLDFEGYRIYRSNPGDDRTGNILDRATLIAQYDRPGNRTGFNNGFDEIALEEPVTFPDDPTEYWYRFEAEDLLAGWQYLFIVTAFDEGDPDAGLPSFESSRTANATRVFPGTPPDPEGARRVGVYPNPYRAGAAWDGGTNRTRRLNFYNLPPRAEIRVYTLAGEIVKEMRHEAGTYRGDIRWYDNFSAENRQLPGGEHSWDILSENGLNISPGLYLFTVKNLDTGEVQRGKFVIIK
ncbi:MAG: hypothetical protein KatS3mg043_1538 [Rhodothermaceae bacterium]|nr:MAG: hypothetical protein KatS3mg043_1538 [Rhodothermaceae bacterium]